MSTPLSGELGLAGLASPDPAAAIRFYAGVLGWQARTANGGVTLMGHGDATLAVVYFQTPQAQAAGVAPHWTPFIAVSDAGAAQASAAALGGFALREPFDAAGMGRIAPIRDPIGATVSLWEPSPTAEALHAGAHAAGCRHELLTDDLPCARRFYTDLLGWSLRSDSDGLVTITISGRTVGAIRDAKGTEVGAPGWAPSFAVKNLDGSAREAARLGAARLQQPRPQGSTWFRDPQGAVFALFEDLRSR